MAEGDAVGRHSAGSDADDAGDDAVMTSAHPSAGQALTRGGRRTGDDEEMPAAGRGTSLDPAEKSVQQEVGVYVAPTTGPSDLATLPGPLTPRELARIDEALTLGSAETGLLFSLYLGDLARPGRATAERLAARLPKSAIDGSVLLAVSPGQRELHIVTVAGARKRLPNRVCALAAVGMRASFANGELTAGIVNGLRMLADGAGNTGEGRHSTGQAAGGR